jgi:hypothetical protein
MTNRNRAPLGRLDLILALALALVAGGALAAHGLERFNEDGSMILTHLWHGARVQRYPHFLYLPALEVFTHRALGETLVSRSIAFSSLCAGVGLAACYLLCIRLGAARANALCATALLATTAPLLLFGRTVEVLAFHLAVTAAAALLCASVPVERPRLRTLAFALGFLVTALSHQAAVLQATGWLALYFWSELRGRSRASGPSFPLRFVGASVALVVLGWLALSISNLPWQGEFTPFAGGHVDFLGRAVTSTPGQAWPAVLQGWLLPAGALLAVALPACLVRREDAPTDALLLAPAVFLCGFTALAGVPEHGGYVLVAGPFLVVAASRIPARRSLRVAVLALAVTQGVHSIRTIGAYDSAYSFRERGSLVRDELGAGILFNAQYVTDSSAPVISLLAPEVVQAPFAVLTNQHLQVPGDASSGFVGAALPLFRAALESGPVALDLSHETLPPSPATPVLDEAYAALISELELEFDVRRVAHPSWPMLIVSRR